MSGHIQDRWWRHKRGEDGKLAYDARGRPVREKTDLYGKGLRYKVRYYVGETEKSESFQDKQLSRAKAFLAKVQTDVLTGTYVDPDAGKMTLRDYVAQWRKGQSADVASQNATDVRLNSMVWPFFKERTLGAITTETIRDWLAWMQTGRRRPTKASYRARAFDLISAILSAAVEDRKIPNNPCKAKSIKRPKPEEHKITPWRESKLRSLRLALPTDYKIIVPLGAGAALRQMEIFGFSPDDIDREKMEVAISRQIRWVGEHVMFSPPKGGKTRVVPLAEGVLEAIDDYMSVHDPVTVTLPWQRPDGELVTARLLISKPTDGAARRDRPRLWRGSTFTTSVWVPTFARAGLAYVKRHDGMHAMRHFCASNWLAQGVSIKEVSAYLGHHDPGYTLRVYTHLMPSSNQRARLASNKIFKPRPTPSADPAPDADSDAGTA